MVVRLAHFGDYLTGMLAVGAALLAGVFLWAVAARLLDTLAPTGLPGPSRQTAS